MTKALVIAALLWPVLLAASLWERVSHPSATWPIAVTFAASRICHQLPDRSFHTAGVQWPVCARCTGLYLSAPFGAVAAAVAVRRRRLMPRARMLRWLALLAVPTALTIAFEWPRLLPVSNTARFLAALPLGAALAWVLVQTAAPRTPHDAPRTC
jgi:uncharacterized membrane protein